MRGEAAKKTKPTWLAPPARAAPSVSAVVRPQILVKTGMGSLYCDVCGAEGVVSYTSPVARAVATYRILVGLDGRSTVAAAG
ncbi:hypothetical protein SAQ01S_23970 [Sphingomonas aquatilis NBRC 16722]|nr:hypothetical protein SAQ01S_23970 [Sphingomonas aquatilis NBRC 16722]